MELKVGLDEVQVERVENEVGLSCEGYTNRGACDMLHMKPDSVTQN